MADMSSEVCCTQAESALPTLRYLHWHSFLTANLIIKWFQSECGNLDIFSMLCNSNFLIVVLSVLITKHVRIYLLIKDELSCTVCRQKLIIIFVVLVAEILTKLWQYFVRRFAEGWANAPLVEAEHIVVEVISCLKWAPGRSINYSAVDHVTSILAFFPQVQSDYLRSQATSIDVKSWPLPFLLLFLHIGLVNVIDYILRITPCSAVWNFSWGVR